MKIKVLFISAFICLTAISANAQKIGYLNTNELLVQMKEVKSADSLLNQYAEEMQKIYASYVMEYQSKLADYQNNAATWSEVKRESVETDLGNLQIRISDFEKESNQKLETKKQSKKKKKRGRHAKARQPVSKKNHYNPQPVGPQVWLNKNQKTNHAD